LSTWASIVLTAVLGFGGLYVGNSIRRRTRAEIEAAVAERRLEAYYTLWQMTKVLAPMGRSDAEPLDAGGRAELYDSLTEWYFQDGNGMILGEDTRAIYLTAKQNLICRTDALRPSSLADRAARAKGHGADRTGENIVDYEDEFRAKLSVRQVSLLRTSMRADLLVYSGPWGTDLTREDREFLRDCGVRMWRRPWRRTIREISGRTAEPTAVDVPPRPEQPDDVRPEL
jgi:hypothetical protein